MTPAPANRVLPRGASTLARRTAVSSRRDQSRKCSTDSGVRSGRFGRRGSRGQAHACRGDSDGPPTQHAEATCCLDAGLVTKVLDRCACILRGACRVRGSGGPRMRFYSLNESIRPGCCSAASAHASSWASTLQAGSRPRGQNHSLGRRQLPARPCCPTPRRRGRTHGSRPPSGPRRPRPSRRHPPLDGSRRERDPSPSDWPGRNEGPGGGRGRRALRRLCSSR